MFTNKSARYSNRRKSRQIKRSIFTYPTKSKDLKMWQLVSLPSSQIIRCDISRIERKMVQLEIKTSPAHRDKNFRNFIFVRIKYNKEHKINNSWYRIHYMLVHFICENKLKC